MDIGQMIAPRLAYGEALAELAVQDDRVVVLDADVATSTQTAKVRQIRPESFYEIGQVSFNFRCFLISLPGALFKSFGYDVVEQQGNLGIDIGWFFRVFVEYGLYQ